MIRSLSPQTALLLASFCAALAVATTTKYELLPYDGAAPKEATVITSDKLTRFTILTDRMIRMERTTTPSQFEDRPSLAFINRHLSTIPSFSAQESNHVLTITTSSLTLTYHVGQPFSSASLVVEGNGQYHFTLWDGGMRSETDEGNLMGTFRTLDGTGNSPLNCTLNGKEHCEWGLISKSGWALVDDSETPLLGQDDWWTDDNGKFYPRASSVDWYLLAHGRDYRGALYDFSLVGGKIPVFPRYASGIWYTRWYDYNNKDTRDEVDAHSNRGLPLDVWVYDMNFHKKNDWSGYTFDPALFPFPEDTLEYLHRKGLHTAANLHDASGVNYWEDKFVEMSEVMGLDPHAKQIPFTLVNKSYANALDDVVLGALEKQGLDFWWIDWQQGETGGFLPGNKTNPTIMLDKMRVTDPQRRGTNKRGVVLARFGGLGNHRYQVGFSGDVRELTWENLAYQPYFSATASNVGYGFWSHDIEGPGTDHEMYARWVQWGSLSAIMRSHERGMSAGDCKNPFPTRDFDEDRCSIVEFWNSPRAYYEAMRTAVLDRAALIPYIYTATRQAFDTGVSIIRPLYYHYPESEHAYLSNEHGRMPQYMFGEHIMVAPVVTPSDTTTMANVTVWLPPGKWVERETGALRKGDMSFSKYYDLNEIPVFVKAGAVIPTIPIVTGDSIGTAQRQYTTLEFSIYPGEEKGETRVYEDDGLTTDYISAKAFAWTTASYKRNSKHMVVTITTEGKFPELPASRKYTIRIVNGLPLSSVSMNDKEIPFSRWGGAGTWHFCGDRMSIVIEGVSASTSAPTVFDIAFAHEVNEETLSGALGLVQHGIWAKRNLDETRVTPGSETAIPAFVSDLASTGDALAVLAGKNVQAFMDKAANLTAVTEAAIDEIALIMPPPAGALVSLYSSLRKDNVLCGTEKCRLTQTEGYVRVRNEGFQPDAKHPNAVPLNDYWDGTHDNWATTDATVPKGYSKADFTDGFVLSVAEKDTVPLICLFNKEIGDHMTTASTSAIAQAKANGYVPCEDKELVGYIYTKQPTVLGVDPVRVTYSLTLLHAALE